MLDPRKVRAQVPPLVLYMPYQVLVKLLQDWNAEMGWTRVTVGFALTTGSTEF